MKNKLSLIAQTDEDLIVLSSYLQDALVKVSDIRFESSRRILAFMCNRYGWENKEKPQRVRAGVHFCDVEQVKTVGVKQGSNQILSLLMIQFEVTSFPKGSVYLIFSDQVKLCLSVETLHVVMQDVLPAWQTKQQPKHN